MKLLSEMDFSFYFNYFIGGNIQLKLIKYDKIKQSAGYQNEMLRHTSSKILAYSDKATGALKIPAHPQELSFLCRSWGALSVPRKYCLLPLVTAERIVCPANTIETYDQCMQRLHNRTENHIKPHWESFGVFLLSWSIVHYWPKWLTYIRYKDFNCTSNRAHTMNFSFENRKTVVMWLKPSLEKRVSI